MKKTYLTLELNRMYSKIDRCKKCEISSHQCPLTIKTNNANIFWVGLSAVKMKNVFNETPLSDSTKSGKLIKEIELENSDYRHYRTNLVKCVPLNLEGKIRYPNIEEKQNCSEYLKNEIFYLKPKIVFLLGKLVSDQVVKKILKTKKYSLGENYCYNYYLNNEGIAFVPIHHPSYMLIYKRKELDKYKKGLKELIKKLIKLSGEK